MTPAIHVSRLALINNPIESVITTKGIILYHVKSYLSPAVIGQFGHCNQDLINLLLTGRATSNVMDGEVQLGDSGLTVKGVYQRSTIGYLSHLEAMRYCEVLYMHCPTSVVIVVPCLWLENMLYKLNDTSLTHRLRLIASKLVWLLCHHVFFSLYAWHCKCLFERRWAVT